MKNVSFQVQNLDTSELDNSAYQLPPAAPIVPETAVELIPVMEQIASQQQTHQPQIQQQQVQQDDFDPDRVRSAIEERFGISPTSKEKNPGRQKRGRSMGRKFIKKVGRVVSPKKSKTSTKQPTTWWLRENVMKMA